MKDLEEYIGEQKEGGTYGNVEMVTFGVNMNASVCMQVAGILDISSNTAASRYRYAVAKLREAMCTEEDSCANS